MRRYGLGATTQQYLDFISQYESNNQNVYNYLYTTDPKKYSAQGYYQITNTNWLAYGPAAGVDTTQYPNAISAPLDVQAQVATYLLTQTPNGISNWGGNPQLMAALSAAGLQTTGTVTPDGSSGSGGPLVDLSGNSANTSTASILDQLQLSTGIDLTSPTTDVLVAVGLGVAGVILAKVL